MCGLRDRSDDAPAHDEHSDQNNQKNLDQNPDKGFTPDVCALHSDVAGIVNDHERLNYFVLGVERNRVNVQQKVAGVDKLPNSSISRQWLGPRPPVSRAGDPSGRQ